MSWTVFIYKAVKTCFDFANLYVFNRKDGGVSKVSKNIFQFAEIRQNPNGTPSPAIKWSE